MQFFELSRQYFNLSTLSFELSTPNCEGISIVRNRCGILSNFLAALSKKQRWIALGLSNKSNFCSEN
jgi:hypothetical protein